MTGAGKVRKVCVLIVTRALGMESTTTVSINGCCCWHWQNEREEGGEEEEAGGKTLIRSWWWWWCCCCWRKHFALRCLPFPSLCFLCRLLIFLRFWFQFSLSAPLFASLASCCQDRMKTSLSLFLQDQLIIVIMHLNLCIQLNCHTSGLFFYAVFFSTCLTHCVSRKCFRKIPCLSPSLSLSFTHNKRHVSSTGSLHQKLEFCYTKSEVLSSLVSI